MQDESLKRIDAYEQGVKATSGTSFLRRLAPTRAFGWVYSRIGPRLDRWLMGSRTGRRILRWYGFPALLLITTGAKSGLPRESPLLYVRDGDNFAVIGTNFGKDSHPAWTGNLLKTPAATVRIGTERVQVRAELADDATAERLYAGFVAMNPAYGAYKSRRTTNPPRMFILRPQQ